MAVEFLKSDMDENKFKAGLGYFVFFLPLLLCRDSKLGRHCANQGLLLELAALLTGVVEGIFSVIPLVGWLVAIACGLARFLLFVIALLCFLRLVNHDCAPEVPYIGGYRLIK